MLLLLATMFTAAAAPAAPPSEPPPATDLPALLKKLGEADAAVERLAHTLDMTRTEHQEELDGQGRPKHTVDRVVRMTHVQGREHEELVRESKDGKDITAQVRPKFEEAQESYREAQKAQPKKEEDRISQKSPLSLEEQAKYRFTLDSAAARAPGRLKLRFEPKDAGAKGLYAGEAVVDVTAQAAVPVQISLRPAKLPWALKEASLLLEYESQPFGTVLSRLSFQGEGGVLFLKRRYRGTVAFSEFKAPSSEP